MSWEWAAWRWRWDGGAVRGGLRKGIKCRTEDESRSQKGVELGSSGWPAFEGQQGGLGGKCRFETGGLQLLPVKREHWRYGVLVWRRLGAWGPPLGFAWHCVLSAAGLCWGCHGEAASAGGGEGGHGGATAEVQGQFHLGLIPPITCVFREPLQDSHIPKSNLMLDASLKLLLALCYFTGTVWVTCSVV